MVTEQNRMRMRMNEKQSLTQVFIHGIEDTDSSLALTDISLNIFSISFLLSSKMSNRATHSKLMDGQ
jgi:hypothetical protein